jgi:hypothetical protein
MGAADEGAPLRFRRPPLAAATGGLLPTRRLLPARRAIGFPRGEPLAGPLPARSPVLGGGRTAARRLSPTCALHTRGPAVADLRPLRCRCRVPIFGLPEIRCSPVPSDMGDAVQMAADLVRRMTGAAAAPHYNLGSGGADQASASLSASSSVSPAKIFSAIRPAFWRIAASIVAAMSGLFLRKVLAFSRPWPTRWLS